MPSSAAANVVPSDIGLWPPLPRNWNNRVLGPLMLRIRRHLAAVDVAKGERGIVDSDLGFLLPKLLSEEVDVDAGTLDSGPEVLEQPKALSSDEE